MLRRAAKNKSKSFLLGWNRGLGDIALGLYAIVHRIRERIPNAEITFLTRENLLDGFTMLGDVRILAAPDWKRGKMQSIRGTLKKMGIDPKSFDLIIERPSPTDWVAWQRGNLVPKLKWNPLYDDLWKSFDLPDGYTYICVQPVAETNYGLWRNWPLARWQDLFERLEKIGNVKVLLFGFGAIVDFPYKNVIDLRGKTTLFQLLSIVKNRCKAAILPDSGILSMIYYLDAPFPIQIVSLWADPNHGILKQGVPSPNRKLQHFPLIGENRDLSSLSAKKVLDCIFPARPLQTCPNAAKVALKPIQKVGIILLAGGQGSRLGLTGPKGAFQIHNKSLFQWSLEKVPAHIPVALMTSPLNHDETVGLFEKHKFFGREVYFFEQDMLPMLDAKKRALKILAPSGNGSVFKSFAESGTLALFEEREIDLVSIFPIENLLADPADPAFLSYMREKDADAGIKCIERKAGDAMGAVVEREGRLEIVEYTEADPSLHYPYSYAGMMAMKLTFMKRMTKVELPLHWVWKRASDRFGWKGEHFIFDALPFADQTVSLSYPRSQIYAPLKSKENLEEILQVLK
jgi:ADP-heptose:LPS heptosyltransferase